MENIISRKSDLILNVGFILLATIMIYPLILVLGVSITDEQALISSSYSWFPSDISFKAYELLFKLNKGIVNAYAVTIIVTIGGTLLSLLVIGLYAYPLSRKDLKYRNTFAFIAFFTMLFSGGLIPWYLVCTQYLHLQNSIWALILPFVMNAFHVIVLRTFFSTSIPMEILESAKIDGSGELRTFLTIVIPLSLPGLATIAIFTSVTYWNDYYLPLMLVNDPALYNLQYLIYKVLSNIEVLKNNSQVVADLRSSGIATPENSTRMALAVITVGPIIFVYPYLQKYFINGLTIGAVKG